MTLTAIEHALTYRLTQFEQSPGRWFVVGPDKAANLIELVVVSTEDGDLLVIHAQDLTTENRKTFL